MAIAALIVGVVDVVVTIVLLALIVCVDSIASIPLAKLRAEEKAKKFAGIQLASIGINIILNLIFMLGFFNPERPSEGVLFILIINLISSLTMDFIQLKQTSILLSLLKII
jgi:hypothetical protein